MNPTIHTLLNTHPVSRNDNLRTIANALDLDTPPDLRKVQIQCAIEDFLLKEPDLEKQVREIAQSIVSESRSSKTSESDTIMDISNNTTLAKGFLNARGATAALTRSPTHQISIPMPSDHSNVNTQADLFYPCQSQPTNKPENDSDNELKRKLFIVDEDDDDSDNKCDNRRPRIEPHESLRVLTKLVLSQRDEHEKERTKSC